MVPVIDIIKERVTELKIQNIVIHYKGERYKYLPIYYSTIVAIHAANDVVEINNISGGKITLKEKDVKKILAIGLEQERLIRQ